MRQRIGIAVLLFGLVFVGCSSSDGGGSPAAPGGGSGGNSFTATIDGQPWASDRNRILVTGNAVATSAGSMVLTGYQTSTGRGLTLALSYIGGPGTYPLGVNATNAGGTGQVLVATDSWMTPLNGAAGTIVITERTTTRIAGTFSYTAALLAGSGPATRVVTNGAFSYAPSTGTLPPLPTGVGSLFAAMLGGAPWNAATIAVILPGGGSFSLSANNDQYSITMTPKVQIAAGNAYGIPSQINLTVIRMGTSESWSGFGATDFGSLTITAFDGSHMAGTLAATVPAFGAGAPPPMVITDGVFDVYSF